MYKLTRPEWHLQIPSCLCEVPATPAFHSKVGVRGTRPGQLRPCEPCPTVFRRGVSPLRTVSQFVASGPELHCIALRLQLEFATSAAFVPKADHVVRLRHAVQSPDAGRSIPRGRL